VECVTATRVSGQLIFSAAKSIYMCKECVVAFCSCCLRNMILTSHLLQFKTVKTEKQNSLHGLDACTVVIVVCVHFYTCHVVD